MDNSINPVYSSGSTQSISGATVGPAQSKTHLEILLEATQNNEKRLMLLAGFACDILTKIRGSSILQESSPRPEKISGTLGKLEESLCNSGDSIHTLEVALAELNTTI